MTCDLSLEFLLRLSRRPNGKGQRPLIKDLEAEHLLPFVQSGHLILAAGQRSGGGALYTITDKGRALVARLTDIARELVSR